MAHTWLKMETIDWRGSTRNVPVLQGGEWYCVECDTWAIAHKEEN